MWGSPPQDSSLPAQEQETSITGGTLWPETERSQATRLIYACGNKGQGPLPTALEAAETASPTWKSRGKCWGTLLGRLHRFPDVACGTDDEVALSLLFYLTYSSSPRCLPKHDYVKLKN